MEIPTLLMFCSCDRYGDDSPEPNRNRVYISYLDSVNYFAPRRLRTALYHEVLMSYLSFVRLRGFRSAHIWACPPLKGDDYVLFCHPEDQKIPREDRLCQVNSFIKMVTFTLNHSRFNDAFYRITPRCIIVRCFCIVVHKHA